MTMWGNFLFLYFWFYAVTIFESIYATGERKIQMYFKMLNYVCSWNQVISLPYNNYNLELIDTFSKLTHVKS
jgi:hypothetical protein